MFHLNIPTKALCSALKKDGCLSGIFKVSYSMQLILDSDRMYPQSCTISLCTLIFTHTTITYLTQADSKMYYGYYNIFMSTRNANMYNLISTCVQILSTC